LGHTKDVLEVQLYCSARITYPGGATRNYWATDSRYPYYGGMRRDFVEVDFGEGKRAMAQLVAFVHLRSLPEKELATQKKIVLVRWLTTSPKSLAEGREFDRPLLPYPLSNNHCLWTWAKLPRMRSMFLRRGFNRSLPRLTDSWPQELQVRLLHKEKYAFYDVINIDSIIRHANVSQDPTTGHMLQTLQII